MKRSMGKFHRRQFDRPSFMDKPNYKSIGYARVSTSSQTIESQVVDLQKEGCCVVFKETTTSRGKEKELPQLMALFAVLSEGDELVVSKIDRLGRTQIEVVNRIHELQQKGIHIRSADGLINTRGLGHFGPVLLGLISGLAEVDRSLTRERTIESIQHRKETGGNLGGRPKTSNAKEGLVLRLRDEGCSYRSISEQTGLALSTIRRIIVEQQAVAV